MQGEEVSIGKAVTGLQTMLRTIAACREGMPTVIPDGIYGPQTVRCVKAFQRAEGLPVTGSADETTWNAIRRAYASARIEVAPAAPVQIEMGPNSAMTEGSGGPCILLVQAMLHSLHGVYANLGDCPLSGTLCSQTCAAVRSLQRCCGMPETGIVNKATWRMAAMLYAQTVSAGTCSAASAEGKCRD